MNSPFCNPPLIGRARLTPMTRIRHAAIPCARFTTRSRGAHARLGHCLALAVTFVGTPVWAQAAALLEEVVVTATLLPETSTSVSATIINERAQ
ncbi:MAG: hypothetical protein VW865_12805, partial [Halieaceae bacterium]